MQMELQVYNAFSLSSYCTCTSFIPVQVKASLFAASYLCRSSEDFAHITLKLLIGIVSLPQTSDNVKLEAIHVFSNMQCSSYIAHKAYKVFSYLSILSFLEGHQ